MKRSAILLIALVVVMRFLTFPFSPLHVANAKPHVPTGYYRYLSGVHPRLNVIYRQGLADGNDPTVIAKLGGSTTETPEFLYYFGIPGYNLGGYALQDTIAYYTGTPVPINRSNPSGHPGNSFTRRSYGGRNGLVIAQVAEPIPSDGYPYYAACDGIPNIECEFNAINPSIVLMWFGVNEPFEDMPAAQFKSEYAAIIEYSLSRNIIPVIGTIGRNCYGLFGEDGHCHDDYTESYNLVIRELASEYQIPLIDFNGALDVLPNDGLKPPPDMLHLSSPVENIAFYNLTANLQPQNLQYGNNVRNLLTLLMLDQLRSLLHE